MINSLTNLPDKKRKELENMVNFIKNEKETFIEMIILFGSYARGTAVEDKYTEDGTTYEYKSDFDLLFILSDEKKARNHVITNSIKRRIKNNVEIETPMSMIFHGLAYVNQELTERNYFFIDIYNEGIMIYNRGIHELDTPLSEEELPKDIRLMKARYYYEKWLNSADGFLWGYEKYYQAKNNSLAAFHLHQTSEHLYMAILLVYTDYKPKSHDLLKLNERAIELNAKFGEAFPCRTKDEMNMLKRLNEAYIESRYKKNYQISRSELDYLESRVRTLQELAEQLCKEYIQNFAKRVDNVSVDLQDKIRQMDEGITQFYEARQNAVIEEQKLLEEVRLEGKQEGILEEKHEIAKKLLDVLDIETIAEKTGLPVEEIEKLKESS